MIDLVILKAANAKRWRAMQMHSERVAQFDATARRLCGTDARARYQAISDATQVPFGVGYTIQVPWFVIAVIHEREAGGPPHWDKQLGQGDPLGHVSVHEPHGRGPFRDHDGHDAFYWGALDALTECSPYAARWRDWSPGGALTLLEEYNGLDYAAHGVPSAYVWSGTDQYVSGKYVADHDYRQGVVDVQEGCAPILARMMLIDPSIAFDPEPSA